jgi:uncharacterized protein YcbK (DUF882 family)
MITMKEILKDVNFDDLSKDIQDNLTKLLPKLNELRTAYGKPLLVTSGLRSMRHHLEIYAAKGITDKSKIPMKSNHLFGLACDFSDPDGTLKAWVNNNIPVMESIGLWMEAFSATPTWLHVQIVPPKSGNRFFNP